MSQGEDEKKTVRVKRRRRTEQTGERQRAEAPSRKRTDKRGTARRPLHPRVTGEELQNPQDLLLVPLCPYLAVDAVHA